MNKTLLKKENKGVGTRELLVGFFFSILFVVIAGRAVHLHVFKHTWLSEQAKSQYNKYLVTCGKRGTIYDANHQALAVSTEVTSLGAFPQRMKNIKRNSNKLASILGLNAWELRKKLEKATTFVWIKRKITPKAVAAIKKLNIEGLDFIAEHNRFYPNRSLAAQVIGFTGTDGKGLEGIEFQYDKDLYAAPDKHLVTRDALGRRFNSPDGFTSGFVGNDLTLTIDTQIQYLAESALSDAAREFQARYGTAIVMNPNTGAILAMAHYPSFNPNAFGKYSKDLWRNRAITDPYEPGSTLKVILAAAALEANLLTPSSAFYCENGSYKIGGNKVNDTHPYEWLTVQQIIKYSSNIGAVKISEITGKKLLHKTLTDFGFGKPTGIDFPSETRGILSDCKKWRAIDTGAISFGQGVSVSAIQLLTAVSAIANGGNMIKPHIVKTVNAPDGKLLRECGTQSPRQVISPETAENVKEIMATVVTKEGTGVNAALSKYTVCGKTGTAQKIDSSGRYSPDQYNSSFVGFAPKRHPEVAVLVILDEPKSSHYGGTVAAPAFKKIIHETLNYLNVPPENDNNEDTILLAQRYEVKR